MVRTQCDICERHQEKNLQILSTSMPMRDTLINSRKSFRLEVKLTEGPSWRTYERIPEVCEICVATSLAREVVKRHGQEVAKEIMSNLAEGEVREEDLWEGDLTSL